MNYSSNICEGLKVCHNGGVKKTKGADPSPKRWAWTTQNPTVPVQITKALGTELLKLSNNDQSPSDSSQIWGLQFNSFNILSPFSLNWNPLTAKDNGWSSKIILPFLLLSGRCTHRSSRRLSQSVKFSGIRFQSDTLCSKWWRSICTQKHCSVN